MTASATSGLAFDARALDALKARAAADPQAATREAARQFEALFMQELVKSMRASTMASGEPDGGGQMATGLLDQQLALQMSGLPGGLSEAIARQLERQTGLPGPIPRAESANDSLAQQPPAAAPRPPAIPDRSAAAFVGQHTAAAQAAEAASGVPAAFMIGQAAHETGWGASEIRHADGTPSYNLFGIKAGAGWQGPVAEVATTEYVDGVARKTTAKFRAYTSYAESFADYARLVSTSPRYAAALQAARGSASADAGGAAAFAQGLQRGGYATDPAYAEKLTRTINTALRLQRAGG